MTGKRNYLEELLGTLVKAANDALPGKDGKEKEDWATGKLVVYVEAHDVQFAETLIGFTGLKLEDGIVKKIVDNTVTDALQAQVLGMVARTAIRMVYAQKWIADKLDGVDEDDADSLEEAKKKLLAPEKKTK